MCVGLINLSGLLIECVGVSCYNSFVPWVISSQVNLEIESPLRLYALLVSPPLKFVCIRVSDFTSQQRESYLLNGEHSITNGRPLIYTLFDILLKTAATMDMRILITEYFAPRAFVLACSQFEA